MEEKKPLNGCNHVWKQISYWDGIDKDHKRTGGPKAECSECGGTRYFTWVEWNALTVEKGIN